MAVAAVTVLGIGAGLAWQRWPRPAPTLSGVWRARVGRRGASSTRDGEVLLVTLEQRGDRLLLSSSAVEIERDPEWTNQRDFWRQRFGRELKRVHYRGEGRIEGDEPGGPEGPLAVRRVALDVRISAAGSEADVVGEPLDVGRLRGIVDAGDQRIYGKLWLRSEQAERSFDLRRNEP